MTSRTLSPRARALLASTIVAGAGALAACGRTDPNFELDTGAPRGGKGSGGSGRGGTSGLGGTPRSGGGAGGLAGAPMTRCGPLIDDMEDGSGHICQGEGRDGVWYAYNDGSGTQWPAPQAVGVAVTPARIPGGREESTRAMRTYGEGFSVWGAGIGADLAFDGARYGTYDAGAFDGIRFTARAPHGPLEIEVRIATESTTPPLRGGTCTSEECLSKYRPTTLGPEWNRVEVPFDELGPAGAADLERNALTHIDFERWGGEPFDFFVDDLSFYAGPPACCAEAPPGCRGVIGFSDLELKAAVGEGELRCEDVCTRTSLERGLPRSRWPVESLSGLECLTGLVALELPSESIDDIAPIAGLTRLAKLVLAANQIGDVSPLSALTALVELDLSDNPIATAAALSSLTALRSLDLSRCQLASAEGLWSLRELVTLDLSENRLVDVTELGGLASLETLNLSMNQLRELDGITASYALKRLDLSDNALTDASALAGLTGLAELELSDNDIGDLAFVSELSGLTSLSLSGNRVTSLAPLAGLVSLETLHLADNEITDLGSLAGAGLPGLRVLQASGNHIIDLGPLAELQELTTLRLARNQVVDLRPLSALTGLTQLELSENQISDVAPLAALPDLELVALDANQITDLDPFLSFQSLQGAGDSSPLLDLSDNPVDCAAEAAAIEALRARNVTLVLDCP